MFTGDQAACSVLVLPAHTSDRPTPALVTGPDSSRDGVQVTTLTLCLTTTLLQSSTTTSTGRQAMLRNADDWIAWDVQIEGRLYLMKLYDKLTRSGVSAAGGWCPNWILHSQASALAPEHPPEAPSKGPSVTPRSVALFFRRWLCTCPTGPTKPRWASFGVGSRDSSVIFLRVTDSPGSVSPPWWPWYGTSPQY